ncbi:alpha/beta hydrolase [Candidatus Darwinibacter acetoxidans]
MEGAILAGAEPFAFPGGDVGCLLVHGFTGNPSSMRPMGEYLAGQGFTVVGPRLKGHGTRVEDMFNNTYHDWIASAEAGLEEIRKQCRTIFVAGLSMGATLALHLAGSHPDTVKGVVPICGPVFMKDFRMIFLPLIRPFVKTVPGVGSDIKDPAVTELSYDRVPLAALGELLKLCRLVNDELPRIKQPALIFQSREDHVVHPSNAPYILEHIGSAEKELVWLENSYHVATLDFDKELIFEKTAQFMRRHS